MPAVFTPLNPTGIRVAVLRVLFIGALGLLVAACGRESDGERFFPLAVGHTWLYQIERTTMDGTVNLRHQVTNVAPPPDAMIAAVRETLSGRRYLYAVDDAGIFRIDAPVVPAHGGEITTAGGATRDMVLPHTITTDSHWRARTRTGALENSGPPWETLFRIDAPVEMNYEVVSLNEEITTPAGHFVGCLLVAGHGNTNADVGNYIGRTSIEVSSREWFAPGVGLVRMEREETTSAKALNAGRLVMELAQWQQ